MAPTDIPEGGSPDNQDVGFQVGLVKTRPGLQNVFAVVPLNPTFNYLKTYITQTQLLRMMALDSLGNVYKENPIGSLQIVFTGIDAFYGQSTSLFTREYLAFSDGQYGVDIPRQYDDTNFDRVSQVGPGAGPLAQDFLPAGASIGNPGGGTTATVAASPGGAVWGCSGTIVEQGPTKPFLIPVWNCFTVTTTAPHGFVAGQTVTIAGVTNGVFNNTWVIFSVGSTTTFTVGNSSSAPLQFPKSSAGANSGAGTATVGPPPGSITIQRFGNVATANTTTAHGFNVGWTVIISGVTGVAIGGGISAASQQSGEVTITTSTAHGLIPGSVVLIAGVSDATYNGQYTVDSVPNGTQFTYSKLTTNLTSSSGTVSTVFNGTFLITGVPTTLSFTYNNVGPNVSAVTTGTATIVGNVEAGIHQVAVAFITRQGYITKPSPPTTFIAGGGKLVSISNIPLGPSNVVGRVLMFTAVIPPPGPPTTLGSFITLQPAMQINDNTSTSLAVDFSDAVLLAPGAQNQDKLFQQVELGESAGVVGYSQRLFWWGERNKVQNFINLTFDGGWSLGTGTGGSDVPLGWTSDPTSGVGGSRRQNGGVWLDGYAISGDGLTAVRGMITQTAFQDYLANPILMTSTAYSLRARISVINGGPVTPAMNLVIDFFSPSLGIPIGTYAVSLAGISGYQEFIQTVLTPQSSIPSDVVIRVYTTGTLVNGAIAVVDDIELFPTLQPFNTSEIRASGTENPESYNDLTGTLEFGENDGTRVTNAFQQRGNLYVVKERSLWQTQADAANEPDAWTINRQSATVGTPSIHGVGFGEDWVVIASRQGLYFFDGGEPEKVSQEIQKSNGPLPGWDSINWQYGHTLWCTVDTKNRRIIVGVPIGNATTPNLAFVMDYRGLDTGLELKSDTSIHISAYTGKILDIANGRKWTRWNITQNSCSLIERPDGTAHVFMGNGAGTGKIYDLLEVEQFTNPAQFSDDGAAINSYYDTYFFLRPEQEQLLQLDSHRKLYEYLSAYIEGQGVPSLFAFPPGNYPPIPLPQSGNPAPSLVSSLASFSDSISSITRTQDQISGYPQIVTVVTATPHGLGATSVAVISGVADNSFNGLFGNLTIKNPTTFTFQQAGPVANSTGGTVQPLTRDMEMPINILAERCKFRISTNAVGSWFSLRTFTPSVGRDPFSPVRGCN